MYVCKGLCIQMHAHNKNLLNKIFMHSATPSNYKYISQLIYKTLKNMSRIKDKLEMFKNALRARPNPNVRIRENTLPESKEESHLQL